MCSCGAGAIGRCIEAIWPGLAARRGRSTRMRMVLSSVDPIHVAAHLAIF